MTNKILCTSAIFIVMLITFAGINISMSRNEAKISVILKNIDALASEESGSGDSENCSIYEMSKTDNMIVLMNAKNKMFGITAGCKKKCNHTCTVKNSPNIKIEI